MQDTASRPVRHFSNDEERVIEDTAKVLVRKGKSSIAAILRAYLLVSPSYESSWLADNVDAFDAVRDLELGRALVVIQDSGSGLPADVAKSLLEDANLEPRPNKVETSIIRALMEKVRCTALLPVARQCWTAISCALESVLTPVSIPRLGQVVEESDTTDEDVIDQGRPADEGGEDTAEGEDTA